jgi:hypothetical protein
MRDSLFRTTRSAILAVLSKVSPRDKVPREGRRTAPLGRDAGFATDDCVASMAGCAKDLRDHLQAAGRESVRMLAELGDATDAADIGIKLRLQELSEQTSQLRGQLDQAVDATQSTWNGYRPTFSSQCDSIRSGLLAARRCVANHAT